MGRRVVRVRSLKLSFLAVVENAEFTLAASCKTVHLVRHTCCTKAPPMMRVKTMS